jgi:hypothetical protein
MHPHRTDLVEVSDTTVGDDADRSQPLRNRRHDFAKVGAARWRATNVLYDDD